MYGYDRDFVMICKFFSDNLGEASLNNIHKQPNPAVAEAWEIKNLNIWQLLDISIGDAFLKVYKGKREDVKEYINKNGDNMREKYFENANLFKNPASICMLRLKHVAYRFFMRESGGKIHKVYVGSLDLLDFRMGSKLKACKNILFDCSEAQMRNE